MAATQAVSDCEPMKSYLSPGKRAVGRGDDAISAGSLLFAGLTLVATGANAQAPAAGDPQITQEEAGDPAYAVQWLKTHPRTDQRHKITQFYFKYARSSEKSKLVGSVKGLWGKHDSLSADVLRIYTARTS